MRNILLIGLAITVAGCANDPVSTEKTDNPNVPVSVLFKVDGCTVYRFKDAGEWIYFTSCQGNTTVSKTEYCGKGCYDKEVRVVSTEVRP